MSPIWAKDSRVALVIGNDHYQNVNSLNNAVSDASSMAKALEKAGFSVTYKPDVDLPAMKQAVRQFKSQLSGGDEAVFYYAGHGVQLGAANYLLPVDIYTAESEDQVKDDSIPLQRLLDDLQDQKVKFSLVILDACRNNPFKLNNRSIGNTRGLAATSAANGQMIIFSAGANQTALDSLSAADKDKNGLFTRVFLEEMQKPGVEVHQLLRTVRNRVVQLAKSVQHDQMPAVYDQVVGDFYFFPNESPVKVVTNVHIQTAEEVEQEVWNEIKDSIDAADFKAYLNRYPNGRFALLANAKLKRLETPVQAQLTSKSILNECKECPEMVRLPSGISMGKYEVTQAQWKAIMGDNPSYFKACGDDCPVEWVSWNDVQEFIKKLNAKTEKRFRLPKEKEWFEACQAGNATEYCGSNDLDKVAWYSGNSKNKTHPVGQKQANAWNLYDMSGNVYEWMQDCYEADCSWRVLRGGSWSYRLAYLRSARRLRDDPDWRGSSVGFRLAQD